MVQSPARIRLPDLWRGDAGHIRTHGDVAPLRDDRVAPRPVRAGPVWAWLQGHDGRRNPAGSRFAKPFFTLKALQRTRALLSRRSRAAAFRMVWYLPRSSG